MSVIGANYYVAQAGWSYDRVLTHYYSGAEIQTIPWDSYYIRND